MENSLINEITNKANNHFNEEFQNGLTSYKLTALPKTIEEHEYSYSVYWCLENEAHLPSNKRTIFAGGGALMISKISDHIEMGGSSPDIDFIKNFELKIRDLEGYWVLEIEYLKSKISTFKNLLKLTTPQLIKIVKSNPMIQIEDEYYNLKKLNDDFLNANIKCNLILKERKINRI